MIRYIFILLILPMLCTGQTVLSHSRSEAQLITYAGETDSIETSITVPARCVISRVILIYDTTVSNAASFTIKMQEGQDELLTFEPDEFDISGEAHMNRPDVSTGAVEELIVLHWTQTGGDAVTGRVRIIVYYELTY